MGPFSASTSRRRSAAATGGRSTSSETFALAATAFDKLDASLALDNGRAQVLRAAMKSHGVSVQLDGFIDLAAQSWGLTG